MNQKNGSQVLIRALSSQSTNKRSINESISYVANKYELNDITEEKDKALSFLVKNYVNQRGKI